MSNLSLNHMRQIYHSPEAKMNRRDHLLPALAALAGLSVVLAIGNRIADGADFEIDPEISYSDETTQVVADSGDSPWSLAEEHIEGFDTITWQNEVVEHIMRMPENEAAFADGELDVGEPVVMPMSVSQQ